MKQTHVADHYTAYLDGSLPEELRQEVTRHLEACPQCAQELEEMRAMLASLREMPPAPVPTGFTAGVRARLDARPAPRPWFLRMPALASGVTFAALAVVLLATPLFRPSMTGLDQKRTADATAGAQQETEGETEVAAAEPVSGDDSTMVAALPDPGAETLKPARDMALDAGMPPAAFVPGGRLPAATGEGAGSDAGTRPRTGEGRPGGRRPGEGDPPPGPAHQETQPTAPGEADGPLPMIAGMPDAQTTKGITEDSTLETGPRPETVKAAGPSGSAGPSGPAGPSSRAGAPEHTVARAPAALPLQGFAEVEPSPAIGRLRVRQASTAGGTVAAVVLEATGEEPVTVTLHADARGRTRTQTAVLAPATPLARFTVALPAGGSALKLSLRADEGAEHAYLFAPSAAESQPAITLRLRATPMLGILQRLAADGQLFIFCPPELAEKHNITLDVSRTAPIDVLANLAKRHGYRPVTTDGVITLIREMK